VNEPVPDPTRHPALHAALGAVGPLDAEAVAAATARQGQLTKPPGSLGRLESLGIQLAGIAGECPPPVPSPAAVAVFAGDHGVVAEGVTAWPSEVTAQMVANFVGGGAAINVLARQAGASVTVVDVGVAADVTGLGPDGDRIRHRKVRPGTANLAAGPAMTTDEALEALEVGASVAAELVAGGARALVTGDMGIGNTTASAALIAAFTGDRADKVTGHGAGVDDAGRARKVAVIDRALARLAPSPHPVTVLAEVGGLEIAALAGFIVGGAAQRVPVVVDGVIAGAALLVATRLSPTVGELVVAGHRSVEPGAAAVLRHLNLDAVLDLDLRLGEGSGATLALPMLEAAARILREMATFADLGIDAG
jgi:nicotinate-nucleotide--dimethylbenzimidazole phosphoribosyltransferase